MLPRSVVSAICVPRVGRGGAAAAHLLLDVPSPGGIMWLTPVSGGACAEVGIRRTQDPSAQPLRHLASTPGEGQRRAVPARPLLRSPRRTPSQVRDAAAGPCRWLHGESGRRLVRVFTAHLLPGPRRIRTRRAGWPASGEEGPQATAQAHVRGHGLCTRPARRRAPARTHRAGPTGLPGARRRGSPEEHHAGPEHALEKKPLLPG